MRSVFHELLIVEEFNEVKTTLYFIHSLSNESTFQIAKYMKIIAVALLRHSTPSPLKSLDIGQRHYTDGNNRILEFRIASGKL